VQQLMALGAKGYFQNAPPDGIDYYEPNPQTLAWYPTLKAASQTPGLQLLGVLIDPLLKSRAVSPTNDPTSPLWFPGGGGVQNMADPDVQRFLSRLKTDLAAQGVNYAFWDMGSGGPTGQGRVWFDILKTWKQAGISIAAESSCDIASYVTGTNFFYGWQENNDYGLVQTVTPIAKIVVSDRRDTPINGQYWWDAAMSKGFVPVLDEVLLPIWGNPSAA
jgi:hypothetical protein